VNAKVSTKYLGRHTKIHLKQLQAKNDTLAWYYGLDELRYSMRFMEHKFAVRPFHLYIYSIFENPLLLLVLLRVILNKSLLRDAQKNKTTRSLEEIVSPTSDTSVAMSSPLNSARDI
jgi:hypothetical protein